MIKTEKYKNIIVVAAILLAMGVTSFQSFQNLGKEQIKIWDEARGANNAIEMMQNQDFIVVRFDGEPDTWNSKTALFIWFKVLSYKIFGINEFSVRFPTAVFVLFTALLLLVFSWKYLDEIWPGAIAVLVLVNSPGFMGYHVGRNGEPDVILVFFVLFYALSWFVLLEKYPKKRNLYFILFGFGVALAIYTKNIAGIAPLLGIFIYTLVRFKLFVKIISDFRTYLTIVAIFALVALYFFLREQNHPGYTNAVIKTEITGMFLDYICGEPKHPEFSFYFNYLYKIAFKNFILLLPAGIFAYFVSENKSRKWLLVLCFIMSASLLLGYSMAEAKNEWYIAPVYPFLTLIIGISCYEVLLFINKKINNKIARYSIITVLIAGMSLLIFERGSYVYKRNQPWNIIYKPERPGYYLKKYKQKYPEINEFVVVTSMPSDPSLPDLDQLKFYTKKYEIEDGTCTTIVDTVTNLLLNNYVISTEPNFNDVIQKNFNFELVEKDKFGALYYVKKMEKE